MRVEPELPDHAQYKRLKRLVGDYAMEALIRIWAHCQQNGRGEFWRGADAEYLELTAEWDGEPGLLYRSLTNSMIGFVIVEEGGLRIHNWEEMNKQIVGNWKNGPKGGRPRKSNVDAPKNPVVNPMETHRREPSGTGFLAISGDAPKNPVVNPIPVSVNHPSTQREPYQRNVTERDETNLNETERMDGHRAEAREDARPTSSGLRYDLAEQVIHFLNEQTGAEFKGTRAELDAAAMCLARVGNDLEGVKKMVRRQVALWSGQPRLAQGLRPSTLFEEEKFDGYYAMRELPTDLMADPVSRRRELEELIQKHPANRQSTYHRADATEEQRENLKKLRRELAELSQPRTPASSNA